MKLNRKIIEFIIRVLIAALSGALSALGVTSCINL